MILKSRKLHYSPTSNVVLEYISKLKFAFPFPISFFYFLIFVFSHKSFDSSAGFSHAVLPSASYIMCGRRPWAGFAIAPQNSLGTFDSIDSPCAGGPLSSEGAHPASLSTSSILEKMVLLVVTRQKNVGFGGDFQISNRCISVGSPRLEL